MKGAFLRLLRNPIYMFNLLSEVLKLFGILGFFNFLQKYLQVHHYRLQWVCTADAKRKVLPTLEARLAQKS